MNVSSRLLYLAIFLACAGLIGFGLILQHQLHLEPCPMCIMQRYAFVLVGLLALVAALINPGKVLRLIFSLLIILSAGAGAAVAARQSWIQHFPPKIAECGADLEFMLQSFPLADALPKSTVDVHGVVDCRMGIPVVSGHHRRCVAGLAAQIATPLQRTRK
jgi:disulfide bond formation protein DsbB